MPKQPALFVDRDGVLIEDRVDHAKTWSDVEIIESSVEALRLVAAAKIPVFVITNQSLVGKGLMPYDEVDALNERILNHFRERGANIEARYFCPHISSDDCECRKPRPGMLLQAAKEHDLDLSQSWMVGDAIRDVQAAEAAGVRAVIVRTGQGPRHIAAFSEEERRKWPQFDDLLSAVKHLLTHEFKK